MGLRSCILSTEALSRLRGEIESCIGLGYNRHYSTGFVGPFPYTERAQGFVNEYVIVKGAALVRGTDSPSPAKVIEPSKHGVREMITSEKLYRVTVTNHSTLSDKDNITLVTSPPSPKKSPR